MAHRRTTRGAAALLAAAGCLLALPHPAAGAPPTWAALDAWMNATAAALGPTQPGYASFGLLVGNTSGVLYRGTVGGFNTSATMVNAGAASQWVTAAMVLQMLRANGTITLDRRARDFIALPPLLANVTLRQLLSHTAGLDGRVTCSETALTTAVTATAGLNFTACVDSVRAAFNGSATGGALPTGPAGTKHVFTGAALQLAGAAAMAVDAKVFNRFSEVAWAAAFATYLRTPLGLRPGTAYYLPSDNPSLAGGLRTTADNYGLWLQEYLAGDLLPVSGQWSIYAMEEDATPDGNVTIQASALLPAGARYAGWHAGLGEWRHARCVQSGNTTVHFPVCSPPPRCAAFLPTHTLSSLASPAHPTPYHRAGHYFECRNASAACTKAVRARSMVGGGGFYPVLDRSLGLQSWWALLAVDGGSAATSLALGDELWPLVRAVYTNTSLTPSPVPTTSSSPSRSATATGSPSGTASPAGTPPPSVTASLTTSGSSGATPSPSPTPSLSASPPATGTPSSTPTGSRTASPSASASVSVSATPSGTPPVTPSRTPSRTPSGTSSLTPGASASGTGSVSGSASVSRSPASTRSRSSTGTPTASPTGSASDSGSPSVSVTASGSATHSVGASSSPTLSATRSGSWSATPPGTPSNSGTTTAVPSTSNTPDGTPSGAPSGSPSPTVTPPVTPSRASITPFPSLSSSATRSVGSLAAAPASSLLTPQVTLGLSVGIPVGVLLLACCIVVLFCTFRWRDEERRAAENDKVVAAILRAEQAERSAAEGGGGDDDLEGGGRSYVNPLTVTTGGGGAAAAGGGRDRGRRSRSSDPDGSGRGGGGSGGDGKRRHARRSRGDDEAPAASSPLVSGAGVKHYYAATARRDRFTSRSGSQGRSRIASVLSTDI
jgi:hypothetical protein